MKTIFIEAPPIDILYSLLKCYCIINNNRYIFDNIVYKKLLFHNKIEEFYTRIKEYYNKNKRFYLETATSYNSLLTVIRQILKYHEIKFYKKIKYYNSSYNIIYYIDLCCNTL